MEVVLSTGHIGCGEGCLAYTTPRVERCNTRAVCRPFVHDTLPLHRLRYVDQCCSRSEDDVPVPIMDLDRTVEGSTEDRKHQKQVIQTPSCLLTRPRMAGTRAGHDAGGDYAIASATCCRSGGRKVKAMATAPRPMPNEPIYIQK